MSSAEDGRTRDAEAVRRPGRAVTGLASVVLTLGVLAFICCF